MNSDIPHKDSILMDKYSLCELLGRGRYSRVYHGRNLKTGESVAVKVMKKEILARWGLERHIETEISAMRILRHPNIVQLYEVISNEKKIYIVMEYVKGGDLVTKMLEEETKPDECTKKKYFQQLIAAVDFCHSKGVYHRDLKPENVLVDDNGNVKLVDFGLSAMKENEGENRLVRTPCGTLGFIPPEALNGEAYDGVKADIWACGVILYYLKSDGYLPFEEEDLMPLYSQMCNREFRFPLESFEDEVGSLLFQMLDPNPNTRIGIPQIMEVPWFNSREDVSSAEPNSPCLNLNALPLLSSSSSLSVLNPILAEHESKRELRFVSEQPVSAIVSRLEEIGKGKGFSVRKSEGKVDMEGMTVGGEGRLAVCGEISELSPSLCMVEVRKTSGETPEYERFRDEDLKPGLEDLTFGWIL